MVKPSLVEEILGISLDVYSNLWQEMPACVHAFCCFVLRDFNCNQISSHFGALTHFSYGPVAVKMQAVFVPKIYKLVLFLDIGFFLCVKIVVQWNNA